MKKLILFIFALSACSSTSQYRKISSNEKPAALTVIATTDFHGALEAEKVVTAENKILLMGGAPLLASYAKILRKNIKGPVIWVDAGDLFQGTMASNFFEGAPVIRVYNHLGVAAAALGNHEFDYGPVGDKSVPRTPSDDPRGALKERIRQANFPFLAANVRDKDNKIPDWLRASTIVEVDGVRVGIVGAASPETASTTNALNLEGLTFLPALDSVRAEAERLRSVERVDAVILTAHIGGGCDVNTVAAQDDLSSCKITDIFDLVKKMPAGLIDVVVAGHTHRGAMKRVNGTVVLQSYSSGKYISWAKVPLSPIGKSEMVGVAPVCQDVLNFGGVKTCDSFAIKGKKGTVEPAMFFDEKIVPDATVEEIIRPELSKVNEMKQAPLGFSALDPLVRSYADESALGNLISDVTKDAMSGVEIGLANGGGLRANINAGEIRYGDIFNLLPFDNQYALMRIPGSTVKKLMELGLFGTHGGFSWSANVRINLEKCAVKEVLIDQKPLDLQKIYTVATSDYLAGGGSGIKELKIPSDQVEIFWDKKDILRDRVAETLRAWKRDLRSIDFYDPKNPRIKGVDSTCVRR